jgi:Rho-binding antiterminator
MEFELDHLFICTTIGAPEADRLVAFGLTEGTPNVHPGQGTANRRFFFHNFMLELLWVHNSCQISYRTVTGEIVRVQDQIVDVYAANQADFLKLKDGTEIRLDRLISVNGNPTRFAQE